MHMRSLIAASLAAFCGLQLSAQTCPNQRSRTVPGSITYGPANNCVGIDFSYGGLRVTQAANKCPTFALITPDHDVAEPFEGTRVDSMGLTSATLITFACKRDYFLWILPDGSQCVVDRVMATQAYGLLVTKGCEIVSG